MVLPSVRDLEQKYSRKLEEKFDDLGCHMSTRGCNDGIFNWFPMVQRFTRDFLDHIFKDKKVKQKKTVLDPFMGSGNTLLACLEHQKIGYGIDITPLFWFVAHVKTNKYANKDFEEAINIVKMEITKKKKVAVPVHSSFKRLFDEKCLNRLLLLKEAAYDHDAGARELLLFALVSELLKFSHAQRYGKGLHINKEKKLLDVRKQLLIKLRKMQKEQDEFYREISAYHSNCVYPLQGDARNFDTVMDPLSGRKSVLPPKEIDVVITSPPYCNSSDYIEMYKLEHWFLDFVRSYKDFRELSNSTIRSHTTFTRRSVKWRHEVIEDICSHLGGLWNKKIPDMIRGYFDDIHSSLGEIKRFLRPGGTMFIVVANSSYGGIPVPTDLLLGEAANDHDLDVERILILRKIVTSGQQWRVLGAEDKKFLRESMLILRAPS